MIEENQDLNLETDHLEEVIETPPPGQPVVVIQYRTRGVPWYLVLPLLVLVPLGSVAIYHRVYSRTRYTTVPSPAGQLTRKAAESQVVTKSLSEASASAAKQGQPSASTADFGSPLALNSQPIAPGSAPAILPHPAAKTDQLKLGSPAAAAAKEEEEEEESSKTAASTELANVSSITTAVPLPTAATPVNHSGSQVVPTPPVDANRPVPRGNVAIGFSVPADDSSPFAELPISRGLPGSTTHQEHTAVGNGLAAASDPSPDRQPQPTEEQLRQDIQAEAAEKAAELKQRRDIKDRAQDVIDAETQARVKDERIAFRRDLREALKLSRREASAQIDSLSDRYGRNYSDDLRAKVMKALSLANGKTPREAKVHMLRLYGVPEAGILDFLCQEIHHTLVGTRNGPRNSDEVRIDAAKQLLGMKLSKDAGGASKGLSAQRVRPAAAPAANLVPGNDQVP